MRPPTQLPIPPAKQPGATVPKVPGAPRLARIEKPGTAKGEAVSSAASPEAAKPDATEPAANGSTDGNAPDFSDIPRDYTPGGIRGVNWNKLHAKADHYEALSVERNQQIENLRAELEAAKSASANGTPAPEVAQQLQTLQAERDALQARLEAVAVERSPRFEAQFKPRREAAIAQAKAAVGPTEAPKLEALLAMPESSYRDEQVEALLSSLPPLRATKLTQAVADLDRLAAERNALASQGSELWKTWTAEEAAARDRANQERSATATRTFEAELKEWQQAGIEFSKEELENARSVYSGKGSTLQDASRASFWAVKGPQVAQQANELAARVAELEGQLTKLRGTQPGVGASGSGALPSASDDDDDPSVTSYADRIAKAALRGGVRFGAP